MSTLKQKIQSLLPERLINAPRLQRKLKELADWEGVEFVEHNYFGVTLPFELGSSNSIRFYDLKEGLKVSITVNINR